MKTAACVLTLPTEPGAATPALDPPSSPPSKWASLDRPRTRTPSPTTRARRQGPGGAGVLARGPSRPCLPGGMDLSHLPPDKAPSFQRCPPVPFQHDRPGAASGQGWGKDASQQAWPGLAQYGEGSGPKIAPTRSGWPGALLRGLHSVIPRRRWSWTSEDTRR